MSLPNIPVEHILIDPDQAIPPPRTANTMMGRSLGDIALAALITAASGDASIQTGTPEEITYDDTDNYY